MFLKGMDVRVKRGETFTLEFEVLNNDGTPHILYKEFINPYICIALRSNAYTQSGEVIRNYWLPLNNIPNFEITEYLPIASNTQYPPNEYADSSWAIAEAERPTGQMAVFVYNGDYVYYNINTQSYEPYNFVVSKVFVPSDTQDLTDINYVYDVYICSGPTVEDVIKTAWKSTYGESLNDALSKEQIENFYNRLLIDNAESVKDINLDWPIKITDKLMLVDAAEFVIHV